MILDTPAEMISTECLVTSHVLWGGQHPHSMEWRKRE
jgi:hypothetical protein